MLTQRNCTRPNWKLSIPFCFHSDHAGGHDISDQRPRAVCRRRLVVGTGGGTTGQAASFLQHQLIIISDRIELKRNEMLC